MVNYYEEPDRKADEEPDFTAVGYLLRPKVFLAVLGSYFAIAALHAVCGLWMDAADYPRFFMRSFITCGVLWGAYFFVRLSVVSKGWLPLCILLSGFAHTMFNWQFLTSLYVPYRVSVRGVQRTGRGEILIALYSILFDICFIAAAVYLEKGKFMDNMRNINSFWRGRFNKNGR